MRERNRIEESDKCDRRYDGTEKREFKRNEGCQMGVCTVGRVMENWEEGTWIKKFT